MSDFLSRNSQVQVTKLNSTGNAPPQPSENVKYDISQHNSGTNSQNSQVNPVSQNSDSLPILTPVNSVDYTDSSSDSSDNNDSSDSSSDDSFGDDDSDNNSSSDSSSDNNDVTYTDNTQSGGKREIDNESTSSVSTTEILSRDPLFLVLSEFLMDEATGNNIIHVGNGLVQVLNKINSKLGRIVDVLEKKNQGDRKKEKKREHTK